MTGYTLLDPEGRLMVFGVAQDGLLWHAWQEVKGGSVWLGWLVI